MSAGSLWWKSSQADQLRFRNYVCVLQAQAARIGSWLMIDEVTAAYRLHFNDCFQRSLIFILCILKRITAPLPSQWHRFSPLHVVKSQFAIT